MIKNLEFKTINNNFQSKMREDLRNVKTSGKLMVFADKTNNIYEILKDEYVKLVNDNVTKTYIKQHDILKLKSTMKPNNCRKIKTREIDGAIC